jgi:hypothetical protein
MVMMSCLASMERSERQWGELLEKAGLRVLGVWRYDGETGDSVIMGAPKSVGMPGQAVGSVRWMLGLERQDCS